MGYSKIKIKTIGKPPSIFTEIYIDGHKIHGVRSYELKHGVGNKLPTLTMDLNALDVSVDSFIEHVNSPDDREIVFINRNEPPLEEVTRKD